MNQVNNDNYHKPTVLQLLPALISGGVERGTIDMAEYLVRNNFNAIVVSNGGPLVNQLKQVGAVHINLPLNKKNPFSIYQNSRYISKLISKYNVDIVHARSRAPAWSGYLACRKNKCHFVTTFHGVYKFNSKLKKIYNSIMTKGEKVIAVSNFVANHILENYNINDEKIHVIHRGVDIDYFDPVKTSQQRIIALANKFHIPTDKQIILLPGRFTRWKGHKLLLDALKNVPSNKYYCLIVGSDQGHSKYKKEIESYVNSLGLAGNVNMLGNISDMPALYMLSDIVISASIEPEAFGRIATEAQAMGKPVIATNIGGACETVLNNDTGWLINPGDTQDLANAINKALSLSSDERIKRANFAREHIKNNFSLDRMCSKTLELYQSLLKQDIMDNKLPISVFIIAKNEQQRIPAAIKSVIEWVDEVIVIDSGSTDNTVSVSESLGAKVLYNEWPGYVEQKIYGEKLCRNDWILNIDADEEISPRLADEIKSLFLTGNLSFNAYRIKVTIVHRFDTKAKWLAPANNCIRLYNKNFASFDNNQPGRVCHDSVIVKDANMPIGQLKFPALHRSILSIPQAVEKANFYTTLQANELFAGNRRILPLRLITEPLFCFIKIYFLRRYFIFGLNGFVDSIIFAFTKFIRLAKLRELYLEQKNNKL